MGRGVQRRESVKETVRIDQTHELGVDLVAQSPTDRRLRKNRIRIAHPFLRSESETEDDERQSDSVEHVVPDETTFARYWQTVTKNTRLRFLIRSDSMALRMANLLFRSIASSHASPADDGFLVRGVVEQMVSRHVATSLKGRRLSSSRVCGGIWRERMAARASSNDHVEICSTIVLLTNSALTARSFASTRQASEAYP